MERVAGQQVDLQELLRSSRGLVGHIDQQGVPTLQRNIAQLEEVARRLSRSTAGVLDAAAESKAQIFFSSAGIDAANHARVLRKIDLAQTYEPLETISDLELEKFLEHQHTLLVTTAIEESSSLAANAFHCAYAEAMASDWEKAKQDLLDKMGHQAVAVPQAPAASELAPHPQSAGGPPGSAESADMRDTSRLNVSAAAGVGTPGRTASLGTQRADLFAAVVTRLNKARRNQEIFATTGEFAREALALASSGDELAEQLADSWKLLADMVQGVEGQSSADTRGGRSSRQLGDGASQVSARVPSRTALIDGARSRFEQMFREHVASEVQNRGLLGRHADAGRPSLESRLRAYIKLTLGPTRRGGGGGSNSGGIGGIGGGGGGGGGMGAGVGAPGGGGRGHHSASGPSQSGGVPGFGGDSGRDVAGSAAGVAPLVDVLGGPDDGDAVPLWPMAFYAFRCGDLSLAAELLERANPQGAKELAAALKHLARPAGPGSSGRAGPLPEALWRQATREMDALGQQPDRRDMAAARASDPFRHALYVLVTRREPSSTIVDEAINRHFEDFLWLRLVGCGDLSPVPGWLGRGTGQESSDWYVFQEEVARAGLLTDDVIDKWTHGGREPLYLFNLLLCAQMFEEAVGFLVRTDLVVDGVHFAVALYDNGLLQLAAPGRSDLVSDAPQGGDGFRHGRALDLARVLRKYVDLAQLVRRDAVLAFHYHYVLLHPRRAAPSSSSSSSAEQAARRLAKESVRDLLLRSRDYDRLVGTWSTDGTRVVRDGCLFAFLGDEAEQVVDGAAEQAKQDGKPVESVRLYALVEDWTRVGLVLQERLGPLVSAPASSRDREELRSMARRFLKHKHDLSHPAHRHHSSHAQPRSGAAEGGVGAIRKQLDVLVRLTEYFDLYHEGPERYEDAIRYLENLGLVPASNDTADLESKMRTLSEAGDQVRRCFADVALGCMDMYSHVFFALREELHRVQVSHSRRQLQAMMDGYRVKARALVDFVGMVDVHSPAEVKARLLRLETAMK